MGQRTCSESGCDRLLCARGLCESHYRHLLKQDLTRVKRTYSREQGCSVEQCPRRPRARNLCSLHYRRWLTDGNPGVAQPLRIRGRTPCTVDGCDQRANAGGLCPVHYQRARRGGSPGEPLSRHGVRSCRYCKEAITSGKMSRRYCSDDCARTGKSLGEAYRRYGITMEEYRALWLRQQGLCAICRQPERNARNRLLVIDHDHVTGHVRGLLCSQCNRAIGLMRDDPKVIERAAAYVRENRQLRLIL